MMVNDLVKMWNFLYFEWSLITYVLVYYVNIAYHNGSPFSRLSTDVPLYTQSFPSKSTTPSITYQLYCHQLDTKVATECLNKHTFYKRFYRPSGDKVTASKQH